MTCSSDNLALVSNGVNRTNLKAFQIDGLFGRYQVRLNLEKEANIFIGENGLGKTTILRCLYYVLTEDISMLTGMPFQEISVFFQNGENCSISRRGLMESLPAHRTASRSMDNSWDPVIFDFLRRQNLEMQDLERMSMSTIHRLAEDISRCYAISSPSIWERLRMLRSLLREGIPLNYPDDDSANNIFWGKIKNNIPQNIIYLPTYRRIENSPRNFRYDEDDSIPPLIHFGMKDVQESIDAVLNEIRTQTMRGYNNMTGILLKEYAEQKEGTKLNAENLIDSKTAGIVLERLGDEIDTNCKESIRHIIEDKSINCPEYIHLRNLLQRLINNYQKLEAYDERINNFANTCNRYLGDKQFHYDPSRLTLSVCLTDAPDQTISLHQLSSGEKQIVSLFATLYLSDVKGQYERIKGAMPKNENAKNNGNIIIIDEPELSLSIDWQRRLLPDIVRSGNCDMLLAVTHSPFIFDNELDMDAKQLHRFLSN